MQSIFTLLAASALTSACGEGAAPDGGTDAGPTDAPPGACVANDGAFPQFEKILIEPDYRAEGVGVFDVNHDGHLDIVTDQYWYEGPAFTSRHEIRTPVAALDPHAGIFASCFAVYPYDLDMNGETDFIVAPHATDQMLWYQNPNDTTMHWNAHPILAAPEVPGLEAPIFEHLFGDGNPPVLIMSDSDPAVLTIAWWAIPADPTTQTWVRHDISPHLYPGAAGFTHGIGVGDLNADGKLDVLNPSDWFAQTANPDVWTQHPFGAAFPPNACSRMWTYDFDGDTDADVVCGTPHGCGLFWWEQQPADATGNPVFVSHPIPEPTSQLHALRLGDLDGDGVPEIVTGRRWLAHNVCTTGMPPDDCGCLDPANLVAWSFVPGGTSGAAAFTRHLIDDDSGVGGAFTIEDVDGRCGNDIVTSNKKGLFLFRHL